MANVAFRLLLEHLLDVLPAVLYGMVVVWAVESRWHWFVRTAVVAAALAGLLALPAHEATIKYLVAAVVFTAGYVRQFRPNRSQEIESPGHHWPRIGLRDLFLFTVVVAAVLTVMVTAPHHDGYYWLFKAIDGSAIALLGLSCVWLAAGRARWGIRLAAAPFVSAFHIAVVFFWLMWLSGQLAYFLGTSKLPFSLYWQSTWRGFLRFRWPGDLSYWATATAIGTVAFVAWLMLARAAGWLDRRPPTLTSPSALNGISPHRQARARWAFAAVTVLIAALPLYMWARVVTPHALPPEAVASDQNYQELVHLADELYKANGGDTATWDFSALSDAQFAKLVARDDPLWQRVRAVINSGCLFPWQLANGPYYPQMRFLNFLMKARTVRGDGTNSLEPRVTACQDAIRLGQMEQRACIPFMGTFVIGQMESEKVLWNLRNQLSFDECTRCIEILLPLEQQREPWAQTDERSRRIMENSGWERRLELNVTDLAGLSKPQYSISRRVALSSRMLITALAIRAYELQKGRVPVRLTDLTPDYIKQLPDDPYGTGPFRYMLDGDSFILYSVGPNGIDESGKFDIDGDYLWTADVTMNDLFAPPRPRPTPSGQPPAPAVKVEKKSLEVNDGNK